MRIPAMLAVSSVVLAVAGCTDMSSSRAQSGPGWGYGAAGGPEGGWGRGAMMGYGYGPGEEGGGPGWGGGYGPGMMGGYGPGMMGGYGPGMMGGYGQGMMGRGAGWGPYGGGIQGLSAEQQQKIAAIEQAFREKQWQLMQGMQTQMWQNWNQPGEVDDQTARKQFEAREAVRKQMFENRLALRSQIEAVLTPEQRAQWQGVGRGGPPQPPQSPRSPAPPEPSVPAGGAR